MAMAGAALRAHPRFAGRNHSTGELGTCGARVTTANRRKWGPLHLHTDEFLAATAAVWQSGLAVAQGIAQL